MFTDRFGDAIVDYSRNEQDTGMRWIDGRPIYRNYVEVNMGSEIHKKVNIMAGGFDYFFIDPCSMLWTSRYQSPDYYYPLHQANKDGYNFISVHVYADDLYIDLGDGFNGWNNVAYICYLYVKKSDKK